MIVQDQDVEIKVAETWTRVDLVDVAEKSLVILQVQPGTMRSGKVGVRPKGDTSFGVCSSVGANAGFVNDKTCPILVTTTNSSGNIDLVCNIVGTIKVRVLACFSVSD